MFTKRLLLPGFLWICCFFFVPLLILFLFSISRVGNFPTDLSLFPPTLEHYKQAFDPIYVSIYLYSFKLAGLSTLICLVLGFPLAFFISKLPPKKRQIYLLLVFLPFLTSFLVRTYAWFTLLRPNSVIGQLLSSLGVQDSFMSSSSGVLLGFVYDYLPFMILPIYSVLERFDFRLVEAAIDLGASPLQSFFHIVLPLSFTGIIAGCTFVFVPILGDCIVPRMLGGGKVPTIGTLIEDQFLGQLRVNWPFGAALSLLLMAIVLLIFSRFHKQLKDSQWL